MMRMGQAIIFHLSLTPVRRGYLTAMTLGDICMICRVASSISCCSWGSSSSWWTASILYNHIVMIFDWSGLKDHRYFILNQKPDPLKYCNYPLPIPLPVGLPFMPCDLANQYELISTDEQYKEEGDVYLTLLEEVTLFQRFVLPASHRAWSITGFDYYQHTPYEGIRENNCCLSLQDRPTVHVKYQQRFVGRVSEKTVLNCCCYTEVYQELEITNHTGDPLFRVVSKNPQRGHMLILPWWGFDTVKYEVYRVAPHESSTAVQMEEAVEGQKLMEDTLVGQIVHLFNGLSEYSSKNDKYGITFPEGSSEEEKCLIVYAVLLIDYLLYSNF